MNANLAFIINSLAGGGAEKQLLLLARMAAARGDSVRIYPILRGLANTQVKGLLESLPVNIRICPPLVEHPEGAFDILRMSSGIIWSWGFRADFVAGVLAALSPQLHWFASARDARPVLPRSARWFYRLAGGRIDRLVGNSLAGVRGREATTTALNGKGFVLRNVVPLQSRRWTKPEREIPVISTLANLRLSTKGIDVLIEVASRFQKEGRAAQFLVAGRGDELEEFDALVRQSGVTNIRYVGEVSDVVSYLLETDLFVLLSRFEGSPNALLEALALGVPSVSTRVGDLGEVFEPAGLQLVEPGSSESAVTGIVRCLSEASRTTRQKLLEKIHELHSEEAVARQFDELVPRYTHPRGN